MEHGRHGIAAYVIVEAFAERLVNVLRQEVMQRVVFDGHVTARSASVTGLIGATINLGAF